MLALSKIIGETSESVSAKTASPASIVGTVPVAEKNNRREDPTKNEKMSKDIWNEEELPDEIDVVGEDFIHDTRKRPKYDVIYKQNVSSQDAYLGMSGKNASSSSCNYIVVRIYFPGATSKELQLDVTRTKLVAQSEQYKLTLSLPHEVKDKEGKAAWDQTKESLSVTLPIVRNEIL